jgi:nicotinamidase-related amidase
MGATDWLLPSAIERKLRFRGSLHAFEGLDPVKTALVVVDLTPWFMSEFPEASMVVGRVNRIATALRVSGGAVAWVLPRSFQNSGLFSSILGVEPAARFEEAVVAGDGLLDLHPDLRPEAGDIHTVKTLYSAFFPGACDLSERLRARGIDTVLIAGALTHICCEASARDAFSCGYKVVMIADASLGPEIEGRSALSAVYRNFGDVWITEDVLTHLTDTA